MNNFEEIVVGVGTRAQTIEDALWSIYTEMGISPDATGFTIAVGAQLDMLGRILNLPRAGLSDADYVALLRVYARIYVSNGTIPQLIEMFEILFPSDPIVLEESFPAAFILSLLDSDLSTLTPAVLASIVQKAKGGGINGQFHYALHPPATTFTLDGVAGQGFDEGHFSNTI